MCLDALEELAELARNAAQLKREQEAFRAAKGSSVECHMVLTPEEAEGVHAARVDVAESKLRAIGWTPPPKRVTEGQRAAELKEAGHTLAGEVPATQALEPLPLAALGAG